jgi:hypothetical protein
MDPADGIGASGLAGDNEVAPGPPIGFGEICFAVHHR